MNRFRYSLVWSETACAMSMAGSVQAQRFAGDAILAVGSQRVENKDAPPKFTIKGTAFVLDAQQGLCLTAEHVLRQCGATEVGARVWVQGQYTDGVRRPKLFRAQFRVVAQGQLPPGEEPAAPISTSSVQDWALIQVLPEDQEKFSTRLNLLRPLSIDPFQSAKSPAEENNARWRVLGFPDSNPRPSADGPLSPYSIVPLVVLSSQIVGGYSGGPCVGSDPPRATQVVGIAINFEPTTRNGVVVPLGCILPAIAREWKKASGVPARVSETLKFLQQQLPPDDDSVLGAYAVLDRLNPLEHWVLLDELCFVSNIGGEAAKAFLRQYYGTWRSARPDTLLACNPAMFESVVEIARESADLLRSGVNPDQEVDGRLARSAAEILLSRDRAKADLPVDAHAAAGLLCDAVFLSHYYFGEKFAGEFALPAIACAARLDGTNPNLGGAELLALRSPEERADFLAARSTVLVENYPVSSLPMERYFLDAPGADVYSLSRVLSEYKLPRPEALGSNRFMIDRPTFKLLQNLKTAQNVPTPSQGKGIGGPFDFHTTGKD